MTLVLELIKKYVFGNDTLFFLVLGILLLSRKIPLRKYWPLRLVPCLAAAVVWYHIPFDALFGGILIGDGEVTVSALPFVMQAASLFLLAVLSMYFCYRCRFGTVLYCTTMAYAMEHLSERSVELLFRLGGSMLLIQPTPVLYASLLVINLLVFLLFLRKVDFSEEKLSGELSYAAILACFVVLIDIVVCTILNGVGVQLRITFVQDYSAIMSAASSAVILLAGSSHLRALEAARQAAVMTHMLHSEQEQYRRDKDAVDMMNLRCHDLKHLVSHLGESTDAESLQELRQAVEDYDNTVQTGNAALNVVVYNKKQLCASRKIDFTCLADGERLSFMRDTDIYVLFGNLLDNCIEASERISEPEQRAITLTVSSAGKGFLQIHVENFYDGPLQLSNGVLQTSKPDKAYHGLGLRSIQMITEKYNGNLQIEAENGIFVLDILLPVETAGTASLEGCA